MLLCLLLCSNCHGQTEKLGWAESKMKLEGGKTLRNKTNKGRDTWQRVSFWALYQQPEPGWSGCMNQDLGTKDRGDLPMSPGCKKVLLRDMDMDMNHTAGTYSTVPWWFSTMKTLVWMLQSKIASELVKKKLKNKMVEVTKTWERDVDFMKAMKFNFWYVPKLLFTSSKLTTNLCHSVLTSDATFIVRICENPQP